jgi:hypothetical protein
MRSFDPRGTRTIRIVPANSSSGIGAGVANCGDSVLKWQDCGDGALDCWLGECSWSMTKLTSALKKTITHPGNQGRVRRETGKE